MLKSTFSVTFTILLSRILGYVRDAVMALTLGTGPANEAFLAAFKLTNLFRSFFAEGALNSATVPTFSQLISGRGVRYASVIASYIFSIFCLVISCFVLLMLYYMDTVIMATNPGFKAELLHLTTELAYIIFPYLILISIAAFYGSFLQSYSAFFPYMATSIILNLVLIAAPFVGSHYHISTVAHSLAYGILISGVLELLWMRYWLRKKSIKIRLIKPKLHGKVVEIGRKILPGVVGSSVIQINIYIDMMILSYYAGGISYLYYADRIIQLPLALFSTAASITLLPSLSRKTAIAGEKNVIFNKSISMILCFIMPATFGIFAVGEDVIRALFMHGKFDAESLKGTVASLQMLCLGLPAYAILKIYNTIFYAHNDTKTPVKVAMLTLILNIIGCIILSRKLGHIGVPLTSSLVAYINLAILIYIAKKRYRNDTVITLNSYKNIALYVLASYLMFTAIMYLKNHCAHLSNWLSVAIYIVIGMLIYFTILLIFNRANVLNFLKNAK